tara:strand:- start:11618 stop:11968 length:351 start_codon:yes stop_codon:yes gene_type:complete
MVNNQEITKIINMFETLRKELKKDKIFIDTGLDNKNEEDIKYEENLQNKINELNLSRRLFIRKDIQRIIDTSDNMTNIPIIIHKELLYTYKRKGIKELCDRYNNMQISCFKTKNNK